MSELKSPLLPPRRWSGTSGCRAKATADTVGSITTSQFVLVCSHHAAFARFEVRSVRSAEAGTAFYNSWVGEINSKPALQHKLLASDKPNLMSAIGGRWR